MTENAPLATRLRPNSLKDFVGQTHLIGPNKPLTMALEKKHLFSMILWGPPGVGKTTIARICANEIGADFVELSAVSAGKADLRTIVEAKGDHTVLFLDEIHRFNKAQQDFLLPYVETGRLTLIGATTENPSFEVIPPLLSRCRVFVLNRFSEKEMEQIINKALKELSLPKKKLSLKTDALEWLVSYGNGDARQVIGIIEHTHGLYGDLSLEHLKQSLQSAFIRHDKKGDAHYNTISAFIKSMRAGNPDAAIYYLARMIEGGEDPKFIARRMVIFASEDIGMAVPTALVVANEVFRSVETIGLPECAINLAHGCIYLSECKKDRSGYDALRSAQEDVRKYGNLPIPEKIMNPVTKLMKEIGYGKNYQMYDGNGFLPDKLSGKRYYSDKKKE